MKKNSLLYIANWKMAMPSLQHGIAFCHELAKEPKIIQEQVVICPSAIHLYPLIAHMQEYAMCFGAQNCSEHEQGAYTGEISVLSLPEIHVRYCIVGHSERRIYFGETDQMIAKKVELLISYGIAPIICIGETEKEYANKKTFEVLERQLDPIIQEFISSGPYPLILHIAYEPVWAIGTGKTPDNASIEKVFDWILTYCKKTLPPFAEIILLYGGSVDPISALTLKQVQGLGGFLVGGASLDFQKFKKIVV